MLSLKLKRQERVIIETQTEKIEVLIAGYRNGAYQVLFVAPKEVRIIRENAKKQEPNQERVAQ